MAPPSRIPPGLRNVPNLGPATARDLQLLGIQDLVQLRRAKPRELYDRLCEATGERHDPCVLDAFAAIVDYANGGPPRPWWHYSALRKNAKPKRRARKPTF